MTVISKAAIRDWAIVWKLAAFITTASSHERACLWGTCTNWLLYTGKGWVRVRNVWLKSYQDKTSFCNIYCSEMNLYDRQKHFHSPSNSIPRHYRLWLYASLQPYWANVTIKKKKKKHWSTVNLSGQPTLAQHWYSPNSKFPLYWWFLIPMLAKHWSNVSSMLTLAKQWSKINFRLQHYQHQHWAVILDQRLANIQIRNQQLWPRFTVGPIKPWNNGRNGANLLS